MYRVFVNPRMGILNKKDKLPKRKVMRRIINQNQMKSPKLTE